MTTEYKLAAQQTLVLQKRLAQSPAPPLVITHHTTYLPFLNTRDLHHHTCDALCLCSNHSSELLFILQNPYQMPQLLKSLPTESPPRFTSKIIDCRSKRKVPQFEEQTPIAPERSTLHVRRKPCFPRTSTHRTDWSKSQVFLFPLYIVFS